MSWELLATQERLLALAGAAVERRRVAVDGTELHVLEAGAGPPLLLLHGGGGGAANWYRLLPGLSAAHHVLAPDLPGFGLSPDIPLEPPLGLQAARLVAQLLDSLGLARVSVLGTSFGGLAGLRLAQHFPQRVERLALLDSAGLARGVPWLVRAAARAPFRRAARPSERSTRWLLRRWLTSSTLPPADERALVSWLVAVERAHSHRALRHFAGWRGQLEVLGPRELAGLAAPVLLLWGERDRFFPVAQARTAVRRLAHGRLQVLAGVGHSPNWECPPAVLVQVRRFLAEQP